MSFQFIFNFCKARGDFLQLLFYGIGLIVPAPEFTRDQKYCQKNDDIDNKQWHNQSSLIRSTPQYSVSTEIFQGVHFEWWHTFRHTWCVIVAHIRNT